MKQLPIFYTRLMTTALSVLGAVLLTSCGSDETTGFPETTAESASELEAVFAEAENEQAKKNAEIAAAALREQEYEKAAAALNSFNQFDNVSYEQAISVKTSMKNLQAELASQIQTDPAARRAWERIKAAARDQ